ncbi:hypothetical protein NDU88_006610 [Pleurodeles waltl]|uniref:RNase III domain-containing protein n=1 Tax=Pleurodeles waltl TaxID=8319 RepID=A0AAV7MDR5_PLEWA|nr:hypothetical protein NDU88_006610 [Pleurodeles waltl]
MDVPRGAGERASNFTQEELETLGDGVLPLYAKLYGRPEVQLPSEEGTLACHYQGDVDPGGLQPAKHPLSKAGEDLGRWARKIGESQLGKSSQRGRGARRALTPLMQQILAVAYPDLDGSLKAAQQSQGASTSGEGAEAPGRGEAAAHRSSEAETMDAQ